MQEAAPTPKSEKQALPPMPNKGSFEIPRLESQSTRGARFAYHKLWRHSWPHSDHLLRRLARYARSCNELLTLMRVAFDDEQESSQ